MIDIKKKKKIFNLILIILAFGAFFLMQFGYTQKHQTASNGLVKNFYTDLEENLENSTEDAEQPKEDEILEEPTVEDNTVATAEGDIDFEIKAANSYSVPEDSPLLAYGDGKTVKTATGAGMSFAYWDAVVVSYKDGNYIVTDVRTTRGEAKNTIQIPTGGFVILFYYENATIPANLDMGTYINPKFDYRTVSGRNLTGKIMTSTNTKPEEPSDEFKRQTVIIN